MSMRLYKTSYRNKAGEKIVPKNWYLDFNDHKGIRRNMAAFESKALSHAFGQKIQSLIDTRKAGKEPDGELLKWLDNNIDRSIRAKLVKMELIGTGGKGLKEYIDKYREDLIAQSRTDTHVNSTVYEIQNVFNQCKFFQWSDIRPSDLKIGISKLRKTVKTKDKDGNWRLKDYGPISLGTRNHYLTAVKAFCAWMVKNEYAYKNPVADLKKSNTEIGIVHERRALCVDELRRLLEVTRQEPTRWRMTGPQRALLYQLAAESGLRSNEIRTLTVSKFDFDRCTLTVKATYSKRRREDLIPLKLETAVLVKKHISNKLPDAPIFDMPNKANVVRMLRDDLKAAGIAYRDSENLIADFHSLRHSTASLLISSGCNPRIVQTLMRHSSAELTLKRYAHIFQGQERAALKDFPDLNPKTEPTEKKKTVG